MDPSRGWSLGILLVLLGLSAFFSASETALLSCNKIRIKNLAEEGNKSASVLLRLLENVDKLLTTILIGNNIVNLSASSLATVLATDTFGSQSVGIITGILTLIILVFSEITPKSLANKYANSICLVVAKPIYFFSVLLKPIAIILSSISTFLVRILGGDMDVGPTLTEEELKTYVNVSHQEGILEEDEREMIHNVFDFGETEVREVMTPRIHVASLPIDITYNEMLTRFREEQFSKMPVLSETYDEVEGVLYVKDIVLGEINKKDFDIKKYLREPFFVYEFNRLSDAFSRMRKARITLAIVLDEYGIMSGIVTLEDLIEEIVGEITDEYDEIENDIQKIDDCTYFIDGSLSFLEINEMVGTDFASEEFESIGGLVLGEIDGIPKIGLEIEIEGNLLKIEQINKNRIELLKLTIPKDKEEIKE